MAQTERAHPLRIAFFGTPKFAATVLRHLVAFDGAEVVAAVTQPDRPCGRGHRCQPPEVKVLALEHAIPVLQPETLKTREAQQALKDLQADLFVVVAYGLILPQAVLDIAPLGAINVHASLLPAYRGAAPIQRAIQDGCPVTGITIMQMDAGMDTGDILLQRSLAIGIDDTAATLHDELADMGGRLLVEALTRRAQGRLMRLPQDHARASYAPKLRKEEGLLAWDRPATVVHNHVRAFHPWPGTWFFWEHEGRRLRLNIHPGRIGETLPPGTAPGTMLGVDDDALAIACADRAYLVSRLTPEGGKPMTGRAFACGYLRLCL